MERFFLLGVSKFPGPHECKVDGVAKTCRWLGDGWLTCDARNGIAATPRWDVMACGATGQDTHALQPHMKYVVLAQNKC